MLSLNEMIIRLAVALVLGAAIGLERELVGKEAGIRTSMLVSSGAALFSIVALSLPYIVAVGNVPDVIARNSGFLGAIGNIVVGIGFLGAGIIIKNDGHVRGLTTAAVIWMTAAVGTLVGIGLIKFAVIAGVSIAAILYILKSINLAKEVQEKQEHGIM